MHINYAGSAYSIAEHLPCMHRESPRFNHRGSKVNKKDKENVCIHSSSTAHCKKQCWQEDVPCQEQVPESASLAITSIVD